MTRGQRCGLVAVAAVAAAIAVWWMSRDRAAPVASVAARDAAGVTPAARVAEPGPRREVVRPIVAAGQPALARIKREYENYRKASVYPHWSQPLTPDMDFALRWNEAVTEDTSFDGANGFVRFDGSAGRVFPGETYRAWISAWRVVDGERRPLPVRVTRAVVSVTTGPQVGEAFEVTFRDDGQGGDERPGDGLITTQFVPSERDELSRATAVRIEAYVEIDREPRQLVRDFVFAPRPVLEVRAVRDRVQDGSLVATLDCDVLESGTYTFYANLEAPDGTPIATTKRSYPLEAGRRSADLVFFGKVLRDRGLDGPYVVRAIHGLKRAEGEESDVWWSHPAPHTTQTYRAGDFSDAEWSDPERVERLANFERVIREMDEGNASPAP
ncbi:MAG: hypothetical protein K8W52_01705 [Deltaproteobacteria bacterium]|nr:hypothetical protein [Deltaproteobacteria bacterium]